MTETTASSPPKSFKIIAIIAFVWNLIGVMNYLMQELMSDEAKALLPEGQRTYMEAIPAWATAGFALAVWFGAAGCLGLILRKSWAYPLLVISFIGALMQNIYGWLLSNGLEVFGFTSMLLTFVVLLVGIYLIWLARSAKAKGWIA
jgi:hypothetical protein